MGRTLGKKALSWFRGQPVDQPLIPKVFRHNYSENDLLQSFRLKAGTLGKTPDRANIDEWLFLMQHSRLPTRLLDWTEGALIALFFALYDLPDKHPNPVVWMLNPLKLNEVSTGIATINLSWGNVRGKANFELAFGKMDAGYELPVAVYPLHVHIRLNVQKSCFTIHGKKKVS